MIFLSHSTQYLENYPENTLEYIYYVFQRVHYQWIVTTFLAFSGYGVMTKIQTEGSLYLKNFPRNRLLKTILNFDMAVMMYLLLNVILGIQYPKMDIIKSFMGLTSIGNSNWYIFTILYLYIISYIFGMLWKNNYYIIASSVALFSIIFIIYYTHHRLTFGILLNNNDIFFWYATCTEQRSY